MSAPHAPACAGLHAPATSGTLAFFEALLREAERLVSVETGQAQAFNQGRASAFALVLNELRGIQQ